MKKRILIDMDDVLADASQSILDIFNRLNETHLGKSFFEGKSFYEYVHQSHFKPYREKLFEPGFFRNLKVMEDAVDVVKELNEKHEVFIVSAAMEFPNSLKEKHDWIEEYFPFISWKNRCFCGDKTIVTGDVMIDDHEKNLKPFIGEKLLFDAIHNQTVSNYNRVFNWKEIHQYFF